MFNAVQIIRLRSIDG